MRPRVFLVVATFLTWTALCAAAAIKVVDDRGLSITAPLRICFTKGVDTQCRDAAPWRVPEGFEAFDSATAEGPDHGPVEFTPATAAASIRVPRKATIAIENAPPDGKLRASIYYRNGSFGRPDAQIPGVGAEVKVPSRPSVLALEAPEAAPDLHLLSPQPGKRYPISYRRGHGWSLVVRCVSRDEKKPLKADLELLGTASGGDPLQIMKGVSEQDGVAVFGPLSPPFVNIRGRAAGVLETTDHGVGSPKGTFLFREMTFDRGGSVEAKVTLDGAPAKGAQCLLLSTRASRKGKGLVPDPDVFFSGVVDKKGECRTTPAKEGAYLFRVTPSEGGAGLDSWVVIAEGSTIHEDVALKQIRITGKVERGHKALPGATVIAAREEDLPNGSGRTTFPAPMKAVTDDTGNYKGQVFSAGRYSFEVMPGGGAVSAADRSVDVDVDGAAVDFNLKDSQIKGTVVDQDGTPVEGARVTLSQTAGGATEHRRNTSDAEGHFEYSIEGEGLIQLKASKKGYKTSDDLDLPPFSEDAEPAPVTLVMQRLDSIEGDVLTPGGAPVPNVLVASYRLASGVPIRQGDATTDLQGHFSVPRSPSGPTRLFATGYGCPLLVSDVAADADSAQLGCSGDYAAVKVKMKSPPPESEPLQDQWVLLRWNGQVIPRQVLYNQFGQYGMPWTSGGDGVLSVVGISPGDYDLFLGQGASEATIAEHQNYGFMGSFHLNGGSMEEVEFEVKFGP